MGKSDKKLLPPLTREVEAISRCISTSLRPAAVAASFIAIRRESYALLPLLYYKRIPGTRKQFSSSSPSCDLIDGICAGAAATTCRQLYGLQV
jgi:hypothetical protein